MPSKTTVFFRNKDYGFSAQPGTFFPMPKSFSESGVAVSPQHYRFFANTYSDGDGGGGKNGPPSPSLAVAAADAAATKMAQNCEDCRVSHLPFQKAVC